MKSKIKFLVAIGLASLACDVLEAKAGWEPRGQTCNSGACSRACFPRLSKVVQNAYYGCTCYCYYLLDSALSSSEDQHEEFPALNQDTENEIHE